MRRAQVVIGIAVLLTAAIGPGSASAGVWRVQSVPTPVGTTSSALSGVSCPAKNSCMAVGSANVAGTQQPLADQWNGMKWELRTISNVPGPGSLSGVSCLSRHWCMAVGNYSGGPFAEIWTGHGWTFHTVRQPPGSLGESLSGVSCTSMDGCTAVGTYVQHADNLPAAVRWHRGRWTPQTVPDLTGFIDPQYSALNGVACVSATSCSAVGWYNDSDGPLMQVVSWDGSAWSVDSINVQFGVLSGVSCETSTSCVAVGLFTLGNLIPVPPTTLFAAMGSPGGGWGSVSPSQPSGPGNVAFDAVSCPTTTVSGTTVCTAVGTRDDFFGPTSILIERYENGTWTVQPAPGSGFRNDTLNGVSCPVSSLCEAVGGFGTGTGSQNAVAEGFS